MAITAAELMVTVGADTSGAERGLQSISGRLDNLSRDFGAKGLGLTGAITTPMLGIGAAIGKVGIDFESAFTGVIKTVDASDEQIAGLREGILSMARELPATAGEIAAVAEAAGQLGIATDNILGFTRVMIDLGETTNLSSDMAASELARLANITGMPQSEFENLGSTIVALGNNLATTESDIVSMAMRIAGAGSQVGMSEAEILSFAAALSSVGIEADAGGSAISRVFIDMANAAATGGADLEAFASVAGMSAEQFATAFEADAAGAAIAFIQGLDSISDSGGNVFEVLEDLGLSEIRVRDALLRAAGASDLFTGAIALGSEAWAENTALSREAALRYGTTASQIDTLKNRVVELGINGFQRLQPQIERALDGFERIIDRVPALIDGFANLDPAIRNGALAFGAIMVVAGPVLLGLAGIAAALSFLLTPVGAVVAAVAALGVAWATDFGGMRTAITEWWEGSQPALEAAREWFATQGPAAAETMQGAWATLAEALEPATNRLTESFDNMRAGFTDIDLSGLQTAFGSLGQAILPLAGLIGIILGGAINLVMNAISSMMTQLPGIVQTSVDIITNVINTIAGVLTGATTLVQAVIDGDWTTAWDSVKNIAATALGGILTNMELFGGLLGLVLLSLKNTVVTTLADFGVDVSNPFDEIETKVRAFWTWLTGLTWDEVWSGIGNGFTGVVDTLTAWEWPSLADLTGWTWPTLPTWRWPSLPSWRWPDIPTPGWLDNLLNWRPFGGSDDDDFNASGSTRFGGGMTWVGERGPELVALPGGSRIFNNQDSMAMAGSSGVTVQITGPVTMRGPEDIEELAQRIMRIVGRKGR
jgi:TP901 family phage tail tape measure protein